jgi:hypothetical protein
MIDLLLQYYESYVLNISDPPGLFEGLFNESDTVIHAWINGILIISTFESHSKNQSKDITITHYLAKDSW